MKNISIESLEKINFFTEEVEKWKKIRTDAMSEMFDTVDDYGIYPTSEFFKKIDSFVIPFLQSDNEGREKLIEEIEFLRQGFRAASDNSTDKVFKMSMEAYHKNADRIVVELGGESVRPDNQKKGEE